MNGSGVAIGVTGAIGKAVDFTEATGSSLSAENYTELNGFASFTVELWSYQTGAPSKMAYLLSKATASPNAYLFYQNTKGRSCFNVYSNGTDGVKYVNIMANDMSPSANAWNHQAIVRDVSSAKAYSFLGGDPIASDGFSLPNTEDVLSNSGALYLGNAHGQSNNPFPGQIDELRISRVARSAAWVKATHDTVAAPSFARYSATRGNNDATIISFR